MHAIKTQQLSKFYGTVRGIENLNLEVEEGDFFGFIGPNGAGKSTTIRTLLGLIHPTAGQAELLGRDIRREKAAMLSEVGYLPSETTFYSGMRVREILKLSANLHKKDCAQEGKALCKRLELDPSRRIEELSLGNRKKVGIVCAMQHRPRLYILDEPTSGLDPLMQREFYDLLRQRNREGATVFLSCHVLSEVQRYCAHAAVIRGGTILVQDSVERLGQTNAKRVTLRGVEQAPSLPQVRDIRASPGAVSFLYGGAPNVLLQALAQLPITDVTIGEPDLEEVFLHFYGKEDASNDHFSA